MSDKNTQFDAPNEQRLGCRFLTGNFSVNLQPAKQYDNAVDTPEFNLRLGIATVSAAALAMVRMQV